MPYSQVVNRIKATKDSLQLVVVPQEDDILQIVSLDPLRSHFQIVLKQLSLISVLLGDRSKPGDEPAASDPVPVLVLSPLKHRLRQPALVPPGLHGLGSGQSGPRLRGARRDPGG